jgi:preprotein translocase SecE subunit
MTKDEGYWLNVAYVVCGLIGAFLGFKLFETVGIQTEWGDKYIEWYPSLSTLGGLVVGAVGTWVYSKKAGRREHHINVIKELAKVTWPSADDTKRMTWVVVVVVAFFAAVLALFDLGWSWMLKQILA